MSSSALSLLNFNIRCIFISRSLKISSRFTSRTKSFLYGSSFESINATVVSKSGACSNCFSLYMRFSMKIFSSEAKNNCSCNSARRISSSIFRRCLVLSTLLFKTSLTVRKWGLLFSTTQQLGEMLTSQSVNA